MSAPERELKCYWLQGLPALGKTKKALELIGESEGIICDPHKWFEETGKEFRHYRMTCARRWAWGRCMLAARKQITPIVVDMDIQIDAKSIEMLKRLEDLGYTIELAEPDSEEWETIKALMRNKALNRESLDEWAQKLADRQKWLKYTAIRNRMNHWRFLTLDDWRYD